MNLSMIPCENLRPEQIENNVVTFVAIFYRFSKESVEL